MFVTGVRPSAICENKLPVLAEAVRKKRDAVVKAVSFMAEIREGTINGEREGKGRVGEEKVMREKVTREKVTREKVLGVWPKLVLVGMSSSGVAGRRRWRQIDARDMQDQDEMDLHVWRNEIREWLVRII